MHLNSSVTWSIAFWNWHLSEWPIDQDNPEMLFMKTLTHGMGVFLCTFKWRRAFESIIGSQSSCCGVKTQEINLNWKNELNQVRVEAILLSSINFVSKFQMQITGHSSKRSITVSFSWIKQKFRQCYFVKFRKLKLNAVERIHVSSFRRDSTIEIH